MEIEPQSDPQGVTERVAAIVVDRLTEAIALRQQAVLALSGGSTPKPLYRRLAQTDLDWRLVHVLQVDERFAPDGDSHRNWTAISTNLIDPTDAVGYPMPTGGPVSRDLARGYAQVVETLCGGVLDVVHLGLGDDGHTASLVPGDPILSESEPIAITGPYQDLRRMSMTAPLLNRARTIVWEVVGTGKRGAVGTLVNGPLQDDHAIPAHLIRQSDDVTLVADSDALSATIGTATTL